MAVNDVVRLRLHYRLFGQLCQSGLHFKFLTIGSTMSNLASDFDAAMTAEFSHGVAADVSFESITVESVAPNVLATIEHDINPDIPGAIVGESLPPADAIVFKLNTPNKGRRSRGRFYLSGPERTDATAGQIGGPSLVALQDLATKLDARYGVGGTSADYRLVVHSPEWISPTHPNPPSRIGTVTTEVTSITVDPVIRTQRRRQIGVGS